jgi:hypothetical protein
MNEQDIDELGDFAEAYARGISRGERWPFGYPTIHQVMSEQTIRLGSAFRAPPWYRPSGKTNSAAVEMMHRIGNQLGRLGKPSRIAGQGFDYAPDVMLIDGLPTYGTVTYRGPNAGYGFDVRPVLDPRNGIGLLALVVSG